MRDSWPLTTFEGLNSQAKLKASRNVAYNRPSLATRQPAQNRDMVPKKCGCRAFPLNQAETGGCFLEGATPIDVLYDAAQVQLLLYVGLSKAANKTMPCREVGVKGSLLFALPWNQRILQQLGPLVERLE